MREELSYRRAKLSTHHKLDHTTTSVPWLTLSIRAYCSSLSSLQNNSGGLPAVSHATRNRVQKHKSAVTYPQHTTIDDNTGRICIRVPLQNTIIQWLCFSHALFFAGQDHGHHPTRGVGSADSWPTSSLPDDGGNIVASGSWNTTTSCTLNTG